MIRCGLEDKGNRSGKLIVRLGGYTHVLRKRDGELMFLVPFIFYLQ